MRKEHFAPPPKWTREYRQALGLGPLHFIVYSYLEGGLESHRTGIYFITLSAIAEMVRADRDAVESVMDDLSEVGLIHWDPDHSIVWIPCVCAEQFRWNTGTGAERDNKTIEGRKHIASLPKSRLVDLFLANWPVFAEGASGGASQGARQGSPYTLPVTPASSNPHPAASAETIGGGK